MKKAVYTKNVTKYGTVNEARERYRLGRNKLMEIAEANGAVRRVGRRVLINILVMDEAIEQY